jgi:hypothetical protein
MIFECSEFERSDIAFVNFCLGNAPRLPDSEIKLKEASPDFPNLDPLSYSVHDKLGSEHCPRLSVQKPCPQSSSRRA